jgi:alpha-tubulin suppressor-like RCC1 family protein
MENVSSAKAIATSSDSSASYLIEDNGSLLDWGLDENGQLGNGYPHPNQFLGVNDVFIAPVKADIANIVSVSAGSFHVIVLKSDGTVWVWGNNYDGQVIGDGNTGYYTTPTQVNGIDDVTTVSAGDDFNVALKNDGTVWTWGHNGYGELGDGNNNLTEPFRATPMQILGGNTPVQIATPTITPTPSTTLEGTPTIATSTATPIMNNTTNVGAITSTASPQTSGFDLELAGIVGIVLVAGVVVYIWMTRKR